MVYTKRWLVKGSNDYIDDLEGWQKKDATDERKQNRKEDDRESRGIMPGGHMFDNYEFQRGAGHGGRRGGERDAYSERESEQLHERTSELE